MQTVRLTAFAAVFTVADVALSLRHYVEKLGFGVHFQHGDPPSYAIIDRDCVSLHLMPARRDFSALGHSSIYVFSEDVDTLHSELVARGCPIEVAPANYDYGMREFSIRDPAGNRVTFGQEIATT